MTSFVNTVFAGNPSQYIIESKYWPDLMICKLATECGLDRPGETYNFWALWICPGNPIITIQFFDGFESAIYRMRIRSIWIL